jgi:metallo-beta-lactamase family protein
MAGQGRAIALSFHGAARNVTGSCHLLEAAGRRILIDCGMFQGEADSDRLNRAPFGFDPATIDAVVLTHAHLDHCGRLPLLVARGFQGEVLCTRATAELAQVVLLDAARIQEEDAEREAERALRAGRAPRPPLYGLDEACAALASFGRALRYGRSYSLGAGLTVRLIEAGHILGAAQAVFDLPAPDGTGRRRLVFSGDIGNSGRPVLRERARPPEADWVVMETTYGDRNHRSFEESARELIEAIRATIARGGKVVIPTFALERAQELLFILSRAVVAGDLPRKLPVYLDSPMAITATAVFRRHPEAFKLPFRRELMAGADPFRLPRLKLTREVEASRRINRQEGPAVILAGSGMCTGGRVLHHLRHNLWREEASVIFVGFAAKGTLARQIIDGARTVQVLGETVAVRAQIHTINGFSAHAGRDELLAWHAQTGRPEMTFLVHGDAEGGMAAMAQALERRGLATCRPRLGERFVLAETSPLQASGRKHTSPRRH